MATHRGDESMPYYTFDFLVPDRWKVRYEYDTIQRKNQRYFGEFERNMMLFIAMGCLSTPVWFGFILKQQQNKDDDVSNTRILRVFN